MEAKYKIDSPLSLPAGAEPIQKKVTKGYTFFESFGFLVSNLELKGQLLWAVVGLMILVFLAEIQGFVFKVKL